MTQLDPEDRVELIAPAVHHDLTLSKGRMG